MKQTILNALWAKIKNTFVGKNSDATLNSLSITGTGIDISTTGSGTGGINISGDNYSLNVNDTIINKSGITLGSGTKLVLTGSTFSVESNGNAHFNDVIVTGLNVGYGITMGGGDTPSITLKSGGGSSLKLNKTGIDINSGAVSITSGGIDVKSGTVVLDSNGINVKSGVNIYSGGIKIMSGGYLDIGSGYITGSGFRIQSGRISAENILPQNIDMSGSGKITGSGGLYIDGSGIISGQNINLGSGINISSGAVSITSGGIDISSGAVVINNSGINIGNAYISGNIRLGTGTTLNYSDGNTCLSNNKYLVVDYVMAISGTSHFGGINIASNKVNINGSGISISGGGINIGSVISITDGCIGIGGCSITGNSLLIQSGKISATGGTSYFDNINCLGSTQSKFYNGIEISSGAVWITGNGIDVRSGAVVLDYSGINVKSGTVKIGGYGISLGYEIGITGSGFYLNNNAVEINGSGIRLSSGIGITGSGFYLNSNGFYVDGFSCSGNGANFSNGIRLYSGDIKLQESSGSIQFNNTTQKIQGYTGTGSGKTIMSNIIIDSSNIINIGSDYTIASSGISIENTDTLNQALGKLEKRIEDIELVMAASVSNLDNRLNEIE